MTSTDEKKQVVEFPVPNSPTDEEVLRRIRAEAERLANQPELERNFFMPTRADQIGVPLATLKAAIVAILKQRAERTAKERLEQDQMRKRREQQRAAEKQEQKQIAKEEQRRQQRVERDREREQRRAEQEAQRKEKEKRKAFGRLAMLPVARHAKELRRLAEQLGEDIAALREEFEVFLGVGEAEPVPWAEPVSTAALLSEISAKIARYVAMQPHQHTAAVLWDAHAWTYDHDVPVYSPILAFTSAEAGAGKTTVAVAIGFATPRHSFNVEPTGASLYRLVDRTKPTLIVDEADDLFARRSDLRHIVNAGWTRGATIPRCIGGLTVGFDAFTPKIIALLGSNLPQATRTRCIEIRMQPKLATEQVEPFSHLDDAEFAVLRRKAARWAGDNAASLKAAKPIIPPALKDRDAANWRALLAIADLAGGAWPQLAREAAERLTRNGRRPSDGLRLLAAFKEIFSDGRKMITSEDMATHLRRDPTSIWADFNRAGPITQRQIAHLLDRYEIDPRPLHPTRRGNFGRMGYQASQFTDAFARYLPTDPIIQSSRPNVKRRRKPLRRR